MSIEHVWYAAFGSNLHGARFITYLAGGPVPHSPMGRVQEGGRDPSPPLDDRPYELNHRLFFARRSPGWAGRGVAYLEPEADDQHTTLCRLWLITTEQLEDVYRQENGRDEPVTIDHTALATEGRLDLLVASYGRLLHLGSGPDDHPIVTFTCDQPGRLGPERRAHDAYLKVMALGLGEAWGLDEGEAARYLEARGPGNVGT